MAEGQKVPTTSIVEEGSPVRRLSDRAAQHDLVVIGHQSRDSKRKEAEYCNFVRYAVAEGLANACPRPLLVVQDKLYFWSSMTILASVEHLNFDYVKACLNMAEILDLKPRLVLLASGVREESPESILKDLRAAQPELVDLDVSIEMLRGLSIEPDTKLWQSAEVEFDWTPDPDTLLVLPTRASGGHRITIFDTNADGFVRCLALPSILMWPEEYTSFEVKPATVQEKALAGESS